MCVCVCEYVKMTFKSFHKDIEVKKIFVQESS